MICESTNFIYPMLADVYYPMVEQGAYGDIKKSWVHDKTIACSLTAPGRVNKEEVTPNVNITQKGILVGRVKTDIRVSSQGSENSITNIVVTNIRDSNGNSIYNETAGPRKGKPTLFEVATNEPFIGPFGNVDFFKLIIKRSENQAVDV